MSAFTLQNNKPPVSAIMSEADLAKLSPLSRQVIMHQRAMDDFFGQPVVSFLKAKAMIERRRYLARSFHKQWLAWSVN